MAVVVGSAFDSPSSKPPFKLGSTAQVEPQGRTLGLLTAEGSRSRKTIYSLVKDRAASKTA